MRFLYLVYQWLIAYPLIIVVTILTCIVTIIGSTIGNRDFWGFYPPMLWSRFICAILLIRTEIKGRENIDPKTSYVFVANHQGAFDIFLIYFCPIKRLIWWTRRRRACVLWKTVAAVNFATWKRKSRF